MHENKERSTTSHRQFFALLREAYSNLPEEAAKHYSSQDVFRGMALIETGYFTERKFCASTHEEAERIAKFLHQPNTVQVISVSGTWVVERTPVSQSFSKMDHDTFQACRDDITVWCADLLGVEPHELVESSGGHA